MKIPWVIIRRSEVERLRREWDTAHAANALLIRERDEVKEKFDRLLAVEPRVQGESARAVTLGIPALVLKELQRAGEPLISEFAKEVGRRLVYRALRALFDTPARFLDIGNPCP